MFLLYAVLRRASTYSVFTVCITEACVVGSTGRHQVLLLRTHAEYRLKNRQSSNTLISWLTILTSKILQVTKSPLQYNFFKTPVFVMDMYLQITSGTYDHNREGPVCTDKSGHIC